jgi:glycosyltransferase involved in cell wall biosynthesis
MSYPPAPPKIALLSNYVPIQCGISTFAKNLFDSLAKGKRGEVITIAIDDECDNYDFPPEVAFRIAKSNKLDYIEAAEFINASSVEVVCVQHEYGIYGGVVGDYLLETLDRVEKPIVVTLHTVLDSPSEDQSRVLRRIADRAAKVVVMSKKAVQMLINVYGIAASKISMIHHGVPDAFENTLGVYRLPRHAGASMLTFGLLSPDKGIENVIKAMPEIVKSRPDARYLIVGATHPHIRAHSGESYRESLIQLAEELGVSKNVEFVNRFISPTELIEVIQKADIYITPYLKPQQITSGTLAYAVGSGKAVISTPYWYAEELLSDDRGMLVPWRDPEAISEAAIRILTDERWRRRITSNALRF